MVGPLVVHPLLKLPLGARAGVTAALQWGGPQGCTGLGLHREQGPEGGRGDQACVNSCALF